MTRLDDETIEALNEIQEGEAALRVIAELEAEVGQGRHASEHWSKEAAHHRDEAAKWKAKCEAADQAMVCLRENANNAVEALGRAESEAASLRQLSEAYADERDQAWRDLNDAERGLEAARELLIQTTDDGSLTEGWKSRRDVFLSAISSEIQRAKRRARCSLANAPAAPLHQRIDNVCDEVLELIKQRGNNDGPET